MVKFENIEYLYFLLALVPVTLAFFYFMWWRRGAIKRFGESHLVSQLMPDKPVYRHQVKFILIILALSSLVVALANPQIGTKYEKVKREGIDLIIALDVSRSMLAEDVKPNRVEKSKLLISRLIDRLQNDRIGLIVFAGNAYLQVPLTIDYSACKLILNTINTEMVPTQGTAIGEAIRLSLKAFETGEQKYKTLVIITDGENHEGDALIAVEEAVKQGVMVHTVGVGSPKGGPIPIYRNNIQIDFKRDNQNNIVLSKLNETMLQQLAVKGDGKYFRLASGTEELVQLMSEISTMEKKEIEERVFTDYEDQFQYFIGIALFLLTLEFFISERKSNWFKNWNIFKSPPKKVRT